MENWKKIEIDGQPTCYSVSDKGRVRNDKRKSILKGYVANNGYRMVHLRTRVEKMCSVHRLVAKAFMPCPEMDDLQINHKDGNKLNNNIANLEWSTALENMRHSYLTGLQPKELVPCHIYSLNGDFIKSYASIADAAKDLKIDAGNVYRCVQEEQKHYLQYQFKSYKRDKIPQWTDPSLKEVYVYTDDGVFVRRYQSQKECAKAFGVAESSIYRYIKGTRKLKDFVFSNKPL